MKSVLLLAVVLMVAGCANTGMKKGIPEGKIVDLHTGMTISPAQLAAALSDKPRVMVGEKHDNPFHHQIEQWLLSSLMAQRHQGSVLMEMITPSQQPGVEEVRSALARGETLSDGQIMKMTEWQKGWPWKMYGGVVKVALHGGYPLLPANLNRSEIKRLYQEPRPVEGTHSTQPQVQQTLLATIRRSHDNKLEEKQAQAMLVIQQQRDRRMAERLAAALTPTLLIAGAYHADRALGVPLHMADIAPETAVVVVMLAEQGKDVSRANADYVWYTAGAR